MTSYASIEDYELRTGIDVPDSQEPTVQQRMDDVSALVHLYLGDCADEVETKYPDILTMIVVANVNRMSSVPVGVKTESVGATSVTYDVEDHSVSLLATDTDLLDTLIERACGTQTVRGMGQVGVQLGGPPDDSDWPNDIDFWVMTGGYYKW